MNIDCCKIENWHLRYTCQISSIWSYWSSIRFNSDNGFYHIYFEWYLTFQLTIGLSKVQKRRCTFMDSNFQRLVISFKMQHTHCIFLKCVKNVFTTDFFIKNLWQFKLHKATKCLITTFTTIDKNYIYFHSYRDM